MSKSPSTRTLIAMVGALVMSAVTVGAAVGPAQANANPVQVSLMPELEVLEAKVPVRTAVLIRGRSRRQRGPAPSPAGSAARCSAAPATFSRPT